MKLEVRGHEGRIDAPLLGIPWFENEPVPKAILPLDEALDGALGRAVGSGGDFRGKKGQTALLYGPEDGPRRVLLVGLGKREELDGERLRAAAGRIAGRCRELRLRELAIWVPSDRLPDDLGVEVAARAIAEGLVLGAWHFDELRTSFDDDAPVDIEVAILLTPGGSARDVESGAGVGAALARAQNYTRELVARPANIATPRYLAERAEQSGDELGLEVTVLEPDAIREEGMATLLAVAAGSDEEPRFIILEHRADDRKPVVLVGKGVTFDAGGLSLKSPDGMESMKYDMAGAGAVLGAMRAIAELDLPISVLGVIPAVENLPSGHALRPGDVIRSHSGKTIEVLNTDAEGRLILADALSYARRYEPRAMVDAATLTGACVVALGHHAIGLMGSDVGLVDEVRAAADRSGERVWPLPLWDDYREQLRSEVADIKNTGGRPAGTIVAGMFLKEFTGSVPWAHLDIAGTAWADKAGPYQPKGPTGVGVRLLTEWVRGRAG
jgi:leucyl aminopeptidase